MRNAEAPPEARSPTLGSRPLSELEYRLGGWQRRPQNRGRPGGLQGSIHPRGVRRVALRASSPDEMSRSRLGGRRRDRRAGRPGTIWGTARVRGGQHRLRPAKPPSCRAIRLDGPAPFRHGSGPDPGAGRDRSLRGGPRPRPCRRCSCQGAQSATLGSIGVHRRNARPPIDTTSSPRLPPPKRAPPSLNLGIAGHGRSPLGCAWGRSDRSRFECSEASSGEAPRSRALSRQSCPSSGVPWSRATACSSGSGSRHEPRGSPWQRSRQGPWRFPGPQGGLVRRTPSRAVGSLR